MQPSIPVRDTRQQLEDKFSAETVAFHQFHLQGAWSELLLVVLLRRVATIPVPGCRRTFPSSLNTIIWGPTTIAFARDEPLIVSPTSRSRPTHIGVTEQVLFEVKYERTNISTQLISSFKG
jgi:hypothetical protein